jgi:hypothetical protein
MKFILSGNIALAVLCGATSSNTVDLAKNDDASAWGLPFGSDDASAWGLPFGSDDASAGHLAPAKNGDAGFWIIDPNPKPKGHKHETLGRTKQTARSSKGAEHNDDDATKDINFWMAKAEKKRNDDDATKDIIETLGGSLSNRSGKASKHNDDDATKDIIETLGGSSSNRFGKGAKHNDDDATKDIIETLGGSSSNRFGKGTKHNDDDATKDIIETLGEIPRGTPTNVPNDDDVPDDIIETLDGKTNKAPGEGHTQPKFQLRGAIQV